LGINTLISFSFFEYFHLNQLIHTLNFIINSEERYEIVTCGCDDK